MINILYTASTTKFNNNRKSKKILLQLWKILKVSQVCTIYNESDVIPSRSI
jgi:hypothetical protein